MTTPTPSMMSDEPQGELGEWPLMWSLRTFTGQSALFVTTRFALLVFLCVKAASFDSTLLLALAAAALGVDLAHIGLQAYIQVRGMALQHWVKRLVVGDLDFYVHMEGKDEICMYGRVLEALRQSLIRSRQLEIAQNELGEELRMSNETLKSTLDRLRTTQDQIISQQKLAELGELSAGVAHEIRNPLQFIKNFAESSGLFVKELTKLLARPDNLSSEDVQEEIAELAGDLSDNMERITNHCERANRIVSDMLDLRRDESQKFSLVDINKLLVEQTMLAFQAARAQDSGFNMEIQRNLDDHIGEISAVPRNLGRVFINIVTNAFHAMVEKSKAEDDFQPTLRLETRRTDEGVEVSIRDNGIGMTPEVMAKVFNPFFTTRDPDKGTGLEMSLSHDIIREHGGTITPESVVGEYTEMTLEIPVAKEARGCKESP